ncbi:MAG TPA: nucleotidyltransferase domain-containing protein [Bacteroidales bacterium]|nr:nucleotidyltransferase domain-containing protein [Bacteroidales bacterium]HSA42086.1 nucleotidyltransferase domain-containing protein [Bacteroidales bacterium]
MNESLNQYGLRERDMVFLQSLFISMPEIDSVILYGSRARGDFEPGSDLDLAVTGEKVTLSTLSAIRRALEEDSPIPFFFDLLHLDSLNNPKLAGRIREEGKVIYQKRD